MNERCFTIEFIMLLLLVAIGVTGLVLFGVLLGLAA
jgi:hypothetical protein